MKYFSAACLSLLLIGSNAVAQTAYRCDNNGQTVYSDKPCADGKAVAPTQETDAQKKRSADATKQLKAEDKAVSSQISARAKDDAKEREAVRKAQAAEQKRAAKEKEKSENKAKKKTKPKTEIKKAPKPKKQKKSKSTDNRGTAPA
jgi:Domain of unknown function (DUF4124)